MYPVAYSILVYLESEQRPSTEGTFVFIRLLGPTTDLCKCTIVMQGLNVLQNKSRFCGANGVMENSWCLLVKIMSFQVPCHILRGSCCWGARDDEHWWNWWSQANTSEVTQTDIWYGIFVRMAPSHLRLRPLWTGLRKKFKSSNTPFLLSLKRLSQLQMRTLM